MFSAKTKQQQALLTIVGGTSFTISWLFFIRSASAFASWLLIFALLALIFPSYEILSQVRRGGGKSPSSQVEFFTIALITVGNLGVACLILADLYPVFDSLWPFLSTFLGMASWLTFVLGYGFMGLCLLRSQSGLRWVGIPFLLSVAAAVLIILVPDWEIILTATAVGTTCIGIGTITFGSALYLGVGQVESQRQFIVSPSVSSTQMA
ncbi:hypothetical protein KFU94_59245 [Chloroflexi bacterium TSY]|nr:hypothetical protein [Chloroflexi bacterium TSY]